MVRKRTPWSFRVGSLLQPGLHRRQPHRDHPVPEPHQAVELGFVADGRQRLPVIAERPLAVGKGMLQVFRTLPRGVPVQQNVGFFRKLEGATHVKCTGHGIDRSRVGAAAQVPEGRVVGIQGTVEIVQPQQRLADHVVGLRLVVSKVGSLVIVQVVVV